MGDKGARRSQSALLALALTPPCFARGGENDDDGVLGDEDEYGVLDDRTHSPCFACGGRGMIIMGMVFLMMSVMKMVLMMMMRGKLMIMLGLGGMMMTRMILIAMITVAMMVFLSSFDVVDYEKEGER